MAETDPRGQSAAERSSKAAPAGAGEGAPPASVELPDALKVMETVGLAEGVSFLLLLGIAMPLKYLAGLPEAVKVVGWAHGGLFIAYLALVMRAHGEYSFPWKLLGGLSGAALVPFGPWLVRGWLRRWAASQALS